MWSTVSEVLTTLRCGRLFVECWWLFDVVDGLLNTDDSSMLLTVCWVLMLLRYLLSPDDTRYSRRFLKCWWHFDICWFLMTLDVVDCLLSADDTSIFVEFWWHSMWSTVCYMLMILRCDRRFLKCGWHSMWLTVCWVMITLDVVDCLLSYDDTRCGRRFLECSWHSMWSTVCWVLMTLDVVDGMLGADIVDVRKKWTCRDLNPGRTFRTIAPTLQNTKLKREEEMILPGFELGSYAQDPRAYTSKYQTKT